jgi:RIO kinase 1
LNELEHERDDLEHGRGDPIAHFLDEGLVTDVVRIIKTGKEASVHLCQADPAVAGGPLVALKVYHPLNRRDFRDESLYRDGEWIKERRVRAALAKKTRFGRELQGSLWVGREWDTLRSLWAIGAPVPRPIAAIGDAILMDYLGDEETPAPQLRSVRLDADEGAELFRQLVRAIELMLFANVVHGDLSPYNVLVWEGRAVVIDLPQAIDPRKNRHARGMLERDVARICEHLARYGVDASARDLVADLWTGWELADLVPEDLRVELEL